MGAGVVMRVAAVPLVLVALLAGCSAPTTDVDPAPSGSASPSPSGSASGSASPSASPSATAPAAPSLPPVTDPVSLPVVMREEGLGSDLRLGEVIARTSAYTRRAITYRSGDLTISGVMNVPRGDGPFPVVVLLHGYIDPAVYVTGQGFRREQDSLARNGYVALHVDYRNHAGSDDDPRNDTDLRLGYVRDAIAAVEAVKSSDLPFLGDKVAYLGRSMGGGVTFGALVARPGLVDAAITYASVSTDVVDNYERWIRSDSGRRDLAARIVAEHGSPETAPDFWAGVSSRTFFDRITEPVMVHHGTADATCPVAWSRETRDALLEAGVDLTYYEYPGIDHYFYAPWAESMRRTLAFLDEHLRGA